MQHLHVINAHKCDINTVMCMLIKVNQSRLCSK